MYVVIIWLALVYAYHVEYHIMCIAVLYFHHAHVAFLYLVSLIATFFLGYCLIIWHYYPTLERESLLSAVYCK